jgi:general L-amino acid transport system substrate-binding protein
MQFALSRCVRARASPLRFGKIDVLLADTSWTLEREALLGVRFAVALFHDGQSFLVPAMSVAQEPQDLKDQEVCVEKDTLHAMRLRAFAERPDSRLRAREAPSMTAAAEDFFASRCAALTGESALLAATRLEAGAKPDEYRVLPRAISREVLSAVVRDGDPAWETTVRWVANVLLIAEENGLDAAGARRILETDPTPDHAAAWRLPLMKDKEYGLVARALGIPHGWRTRAVAAAGNYREIFERNLGAGSAMALERGPNRLSGEGGLLFAPPLR